MCSLTKPGMRQRTVEIKKEKERETEIDRQTDRQRQRDKERERERKVMHLGAAFGTVHDCVTSKHGERV